MNRPSATTKTAKSVRRAVRRRQKAAKTPFYQRTCVWARAVLVTLALLLILSILAVT